MDKPARIGGLNNKPTTQGGWFFLPATAEELIEIEKKAKLVRKRKGIGKKIGRKPWGVSAERHIADLCLQLPNKDNIDEPRMYVTGSIRNKNYEDIFFSYWVRVYKMK